MVTEELKLQVSRMHKLDGSGATKAFCDLSVLDSFVVKGLRVVEGENGLFVSMPQEAGKDGKWYNTVIPLNREVRDEIEQNLIQQERMKEMQRWLDTLRQNAYIKIYS